MKKIIALLLAVMMVVGLFAACGGGETTPDTTPDATGDNTEVKGSVYYLNFKPEADQAWQDLAKTYTEKTGVEVKVVTAASGDYDKTLIAQMGKSGAPTLFNCGNASALLNWDEYCLDLTDAEFVNELTTKDFNLYNANGELKAVGYCYESFGIIVNKALLKQAGYEITDIKDFASLKTIAEDIHARAAELGFDAFSASGLDGSSSWRFSGHLANMPLFYQFRDDGVTVQPATITNKYLENFKNIWDLYINNSAADKATLTTSTGDASVEEFGTGKAVFYQNGTWEFDKLTGTAEGQYGLKAEDLQMIPIYCGAEGEDKAALCSGTENCWAVNAKADEADIKATLDFINWVVTSEEGTAMMMQQFGAIPFKKAPASTNKFVADGNDLLANGNYAVTWAFNHTPNVDSWRAGVVTALAAYSAGTGEWAAVEQAFVDGWAIEYQTVNG